jgi:hypothetical protein
MGVESEIAPLSNEPSAVGEVIAVSTVHFEAQSYRLNEAPPFGSLVLTHDPGGSRHYGLCAATETTGIEPGRLPIAWGEAGDSDEDIYDRQPQLRHVLRTTFSCVLVGYQRPGGPPIQGVPGRPPRVHERVSRASEEEVRMFFAVHAYLRFLLRANLDHVEDLMAAAIGHAYRAVGCNRTYLVNAGRSAARLLASDHERLTAVLELLAAHEVRE